MVFTPSAETLGDSPWTLSCGITSESGGIEMACRQTDLAHCAPPAAATAAAAFAAAASRICSRLVAMPPPPSPPLGGSRAHRRAWSSEAADGYVGEPCLCTLDTKIGRGVKGEVKGGEGGGGGEWGRGKRFGFLKWSKHGGACDKWVQTWERV